MNKFTKLTLALLLAAGTVSNADASYKAKKEDPSAKVETTPAPSKPGRYGTVKVETTPAPSKPGRYSTVKVETTPAPSKPGRYGTVKVEITPKAPKVVAEVQQLADLTKLYDALVVREGDAQKALLKLQGEHAALVKIADQAAEDRDNFEKDFNDADAHIKTILEPRVQELEDLNAALLKGGEAFVAILDTKALDKALQNVKPAEIADDLTDFADLVRKVTAGPAVDPVKAEKDADFKQTEAMMTVDISAYAKEADAAALLGDIEKHILKLEAFAATHTIDVTKADDGDLGEDIANLKARAAELHKLDGAK